MSKPASYDFNVFINCPFDNQYEPLLYAIAFAVEDCGFRFRCALEDDDNAEARLEKIKRIISECRLGIHDISRTQTTRVQDAEFPRFNMPFELGLFMGAKEYGADDDRVKKLLILDSDSGQYRITTSDLAGLDIHLHHNSPSEAVKEVCRWLSVVSGYSVPGGTAVLSRYEVFQSEYPSICERLQRTTEEIPFSDYLGIVIDWLFNHYAQNC